MVRPSAIALSKALETFSQRPVTVVGAAGALGDSVLLSLSAVSVPPQPASITVARASTTHRIRMAAPMVSEETVPYFSHSSEAIADELRRNADTAGCAFRVQVPIAVQREAHRGVPSPHRDLLGTRPGRNPQRHCGMAKVMNAQPFQA